MKPESLICMAGYAISAGMILIMMGHEGAESWREQVFAGVMAMPVGYWCAHLDQVER